MKEQGRAGGPIHHWPGSIPGSIRHLHNPRRGKAEEPGQEDGIPDYPDSEGTHGDL